MNAMNAKRDCDQIRRDIVAYRSGWLDQTRAAAIAAHLDSCAECVAELQRDERLQTALASMEREAPRPVTWAEVAAARGGATERPRFAWRPALGLSGAVAAAALTVALLAIRPHGVVVHPTNGANPATVRSPGTRDHVSPGQPVDDGSQATSPLVAHSMISAGAATGDPNRDIILMYTVARQ
jgi:anti-sigma factor RsiW